MKKDGRKNNGGKRPGSGRPKKEPTVTLSYRVPKSTAADLDAKIKALIVGGGVGAVLSH